MSKHRSIGYAHFVFLCAHNALAIYSQNSRSEALITLFETEFQMKLSGVVLAVPYLTKTKYRKQK